MRLYKDVLMGEVPVQNDQYYLARWKTRGELTLVWIGNQDYLYPVAVVGSDVFYALDEFELIRRLDLEALSHIYNDILGRTK